MKARARSLCCIEWRVIALKDIKQIKNEHNNSYLVLDYMVHTTQHGHFPGYLVTTQTRTSPTTRPKCAYFSEDDACTPVVSCTVMCALCGMYPPPNIATPPPLSFQPLLFHVYLSSIRRDCGSNEKKNGGFVYERSPPVFRQMNEILSGVVTFPRPS